jgi:hypothetical protein
MSDCPAHEEQAPTPQEIEHRRLELVLEELRRAHARLTLCSKTRQIEAAAGKIWEAIEAVYARWELLRH